MSRRRGSGPRPVVAVCHVLVDCEGPKIQRAASLLVKGMVEQMGLPDAVGVFLVATEQTMTAVLHADTPMPEVNIDALTTLLDTLKARVLHHAECAKGINDVPKKAVVH